MLPRSPVAWTVVLFVGLGCLLGADRASAQVAAMRRSASREGRGGGSPASGSSSRSEWRTRRKHKRSTKEALLQKLGKAGPSSASGADDDEADAGIDRGTLAILEETCRVAEHATGRPCRALEYGCGVRK